MRDALSDLLQAETRYAPVVDGDGRIAGVLSVEIISEFLPRRRRWSRSTRPPSGRSPIVIAALIPLAQGRRLRPRPRRGRDRVRRRERHGLLRLGARQHRPLRHADARAPGAGRRLGRGRLRDRDRPGAASRIAAAGWCRRSPASPASSTPSRASRSSCILLPITGRGNDDRDHRPHALQAADPLPQHRHRAGERPGAAQGRRAGDGDDRPPAALAGRVAAGGAGDHRRTADRDRLDGCDRDARVLRRRAAGSARRSTATSRSRPGSSSAGRSRSRWRSASTFSTSRRSGSSRRGGGCGRYERAVVLADLFDSFSDAIQFIFEPQVGPAGRGRQGRRPRPGLGADVDADLDQRRSRSRSPARSRSRSASTSATAAPASCSRSRSATPAARSPSSP